MSKDTKCQMTQNFKWHRMSNDTKWKIKRNDDWPMTHDTCQITKYKWHMTHDSWQKNMTNEPKCQITHYIHDTWHIKHDPLHMMHDALHMMHDAW